MFQRLDKRRLKVAQDEGCACAVHCLDWCQWNEHPQSTRKKETSSLFFIKLNESETQHVMRVGDAKEICVTLKASFSVAMLEI